MKCSKCGAEFEGKFCSECGTPVEQQTVQTNPTVSSPQQPTYQNVAVPAKKKGGCLKVVLIVLGVSFGIAVVGNIVNSVTSTPASTTSTGATSSIVASATPQESSAPANEPEITAEEFSKIQNGMTYDEVKEIIGSEGTVLSEVGEPGTQYYTVMVQWYGKGSIGANANFTFQNGKLQAKAQIGLQ